MNVGGMGTKADKRKTLIESVKNTNDITIMTETKFKTENIQTLKQEWNGLSIHSTATNARAGVSILFKKGLPFELTSSNDGDNEGRTLWAEIKISSKKVLVIGVYAPADKDDPLFFENLFSLLGKSNYDHVIIGGDFNVGLDEKLDYKGYTSTSTRPRSRETLKKLMKQHDVIDVFRDRNPTLVENTWQQRDVRQARNVKQARLDYFLVDNELGSFIELVGAAEPWNPAFDHRAVLLKVDLGRVQRGQGYWKMNNSLLDDPVYVDLVHNTIIKVIVSYQSVEPGREILSRSQIEALSPEERSNVKMSLNPHQFLEFLMYRIQCATRKYGAKRKKGLIERVEQLEEELMELKKTTDEAAKFNAQTGHDFSPEKEIEIIEALEKANEKGEKKNSYTLTLTKELMSELASTGNVRAKLAPSCSFSRRNGGVSKGILES